VWEKREKVKKELMEFHISPQLWGNFNTITKLNHKVSAFELIKRPQVSIQDIYAVSGMEDLKDRDIAVTVEANIKYSGFIEKQKKEIERQKKIEDTVIPFDIDYEFIEGLLKESREKLIKIRPCTLGVASRISGVTPADISVLIMHILKRNKCTVSHETMDKGI
jgi:tRNA uridine 5-carboxymethylaminomethyl modification enzyme